MMDEFFMLIVPGVISLANQIRFLWGGVWGACWILGLAFLFSLDAQERVLFGMFVCRRFGDVIGRIVA